MVKVPDKILKTHRILWSALFASVVLLILASFVLNPIPALDESSILPNWSNIIELVLTTVAVVNVLLVGGGAVDRFAKNLLPKQTVKSQEISAQSQAAEQRGDEIFFLHYNKMVLSMAILESAVIMGFVVAQQGGSAWKILPFTFVYLLFAPRYFPRSEIRL